MACYVAGAHLVNYLPWNLRLRVRCVASLAEAAVAVALSVVLPDSPARLQLAVCCACLYLGTSAFFAGARACVQMKGSMHAPWLLPLSGSFRIHRATIT